MTRQDEIREIISAGDLVNETINTEGWKRHIGPLFQKKIEELDTLEGVEDIEELRARQKTIEMLQSIHKDIQGFLSDSKAAMVEMENLQTNQ